MPNGKPGDHPLTDILHYGANVFGPDIDGLVRDLASAPGFGRVRERLAGLLWDHWPAWQNVTPDLASVRAGLEALGREAAEAEPLS